jgi:hypothetical protein
MRMTLHNVGVGSLKDTKNEEKREKGIYRMCQNCILLILEVIP